MNIPMKIIKVSCKYADINCNFYIALMQKVNTFQKLMFQNHNNQCLTLKGYKLLVARLTQLLVSNKLGFKDSIWWMHKHRMLMINLYRVVLYWVDMGMFSWKGNISIHCKWGILENRHVFLYNCSVPYQIQWVHSLSFLFSV